MFTYIGIEAGRSVSVGTSETIVYLFKSDDKNDRTKDLLRHRNCPRIWSKHPDYKLLFVKKDGLSVEQAGGSEWSRWSVTAVYTKLTEEEKEQEEKGELPDPEKETDFDDTSSESNVDWDVKFSVTFDDYPIPMMIAFDYHTDIVGTFKTSRKKSTKKIPIVASNMEPYDPPPEVFQQSATIRVARNLDIDKCSEWFKEAIELKNTVNEDPWDVKMAWNQPVLFFVSQFTSRLKIAIGEVQRYDSGGFGNLLGQYAQLELQFVIDPETWGTNVLDVGTYYLEPEDPVGLQRRIETGKFGLEPDTKQVPFKDAEGNRVQGLLNGSGGKIGTGPDLGDAAFNEYFGYDLGEHGKLYRKMMSTENKDVKGD